MSDIHAPLISRRRTQEEEEEDEYNSHQQQHNFDDEDGQERRTTDYGSGIYHYPPHLQPGHFTSLEKLFFFLCSLLLILLFIFVGLYARSSQKEDDDPASRMPAPKIPKNHTKNEVPKRTMGYEIVHDYLFVCFYFFSLIVWTIVVSSLQPIYYK